MKTRRYFNKVGNGTGYNIKNAAEATEIYIYDEISLWGVDAETFAKDLKEITGDINIHINSPGGSVFDGMAIHNAIKDYSRGSKTVIVDGLAASAASYIALAGDTVKINQGAFFMIHDAWTILAGNAADFLKEAEFLEKVDGQIAGFYARKTGKDLEEIKEKMSDETWFTADEALEFGLVDEVLDSEKTAENLFDLSVFNKTPESLTHPDGRETRQPRDFEKALRDAGMTRKQAKAVLAEGLKAIEPEQPISQKEKFVLECEFELNELEF